MPFAKALLLYIAAVSVGEALLAGPAHAGLQSPPRAVLPGYQIVLPFPASGSQQFSPSPLRSALFAPAPHAFPAYAPAGSLLPFVPTTTEVDNFLDAEVRPAVYSAGPVSGPRHPLVLRPFVQPADGDLARVSQHGESAYPDAGQPVPQLYSQPTSHPVVHSNGIASRVTQQAPSSADHAYQTQHSAVQQFLASQHTPTNFASPRFQHTQPASEASGLRLPSQYGVTDIRAQQQRQQLFADHPLDHQFQSLHAADDRYFQRPQVTGRFNTFQFAYSDPTEDPQFLTPEAQHRIQHNRYNGLQSSNEYRSNTDGSIDSTYHQIKSLTAQDRELPVLPPSPSEVRSRLLLQTSSEQDHRQSYRVDVEGNGYGYRYAVQSNRNHNQDVPNRQQENIVSITPASHHVN